MPAHFMYNLPQSTAGVFSQALEAVEALPVHTRVITIYGEAIVIEFRPSDSIYKVRRADGVYIPSKQQLLSSRLHVLTAEINTIDVPLDMPLFQVQLAWGVGFLHHLAVLGAEHLSPSALNVGVRFIHKVGVPSRRKPVWNL